MNVSLYEISADFLKALDGLEVDEETGEIMNFDAVEAFITDRTSASTMPTRSWVSAGRTAKSTSLRKYSRSRIP